MLNNLIHFLMNSIYKVSFLASSINLTMLLYEHNDNDNAGIWKCPVFITITVLRIYVVPDEVSSRDFRHSW